MISLLNVNYKYPNTEFKIKNINYNFEDGLIYAIIGNNGSGKSTLTQIISGLLKPKTGDIKFNDVPIKNAIKNLKLIIGIVFSNPDNQIIFNNVYDDIVFTLKNYKIDSSEFDERINYALTCVNMLDYKFSETISLSSGQKQRIAIAGMLALKPQVLIFDECTSLLDPTSKEELYKIFLNLKKQNILVIFTTNIIDEIIYADKVIIMDNGEIIQSNTSIETIKNLNVFNQIKMDIPAKMRLYNLLLNKNIITELNDETLIKSIESLL